MVLKTYLFATFDDQILNHLAKSNSAYTYVLSDYYLFKQLDDIKAYDEAKSQPSELISFEQAIDEIK